MSSFLGFIKSLFCNISIVLAKASEYDSIRTVATI